MAKQLILITDLAIFNTPNSVDKLKRILYGRLRTILPSNILDDLTEEGQCAGRRFVRSMPSVSALWKSPFPLELVRKAQGADEPGPEPPHSR